MCLLCQWVFTNDAMKRSKMKVLKEKIRNQPN
ncbi:hypothetical protein T05_3087 [Trichinella murrelli]|nr:hypothetical protein T05_3087 [Trichinella murrelli]